MNKYLVQTIRSRNGTTSGVFIHTHNIKYALPLQDHYKSPHNSYFPYFTLFLEASTNIFF